MKLRRMIHGARKWYTQIYKHRLKVNIDRKDSLPFFTKLKYNLRGFTVQDYFDFNLAENDYHDYISFWERLRLEDINGRVAYFLGEKLTFERFFGQVIHVPHIFAWIHRGKAIDPHTGEAADLPAVLRENKILIAKPTRSVGGGTGVKRFEYLDGQYYLNGERISESVLTGNLWPLEEYLFVEYIHQAKYASDYYAKTTNTIRVVTGIHKDGSVEFLFAFHRFGNEESYPVDNLSSGGLFAFVNTDGTMTKARKLTSDSFFSIHPDTGTVIEGARIPDWEYIVDSLLKAHQQFPYYTFFAWDVVIDETGVPYILEINRGSDLEIQSIHPLRYEKLGEFMREYNLLDKKNDRV